MMVKTWAVYSKDYFLVTKISTLLDHPVLDRKAPALDFSRVHFLLQASASYLGTYKLVNRKYIYMLHSSLNRFSFHEKQEHFRSGLSELFLSLTLYEREPV